MPGLRSRKPNTPCGLGREPSAHTPAHGTATSLLHQVTERVHTAQSLLHNRGARPRHPHTPGGPTAPQRKPQLCREGTGPSTSSGVESSWGSGGEDTRPGARALRAPPPAHGETPDSTRLPIPGAGFWLGCDRLVILAVSVVAVVMELVLMAVMVTVLVETEVTVVVTEGWQGQQKRWCCWEVTIVEVAMVAEAACKR
ncbi:unnamed protein product [Rangifer tarandus platyrhynchus]|uniref:Uncharacterized protein n=2 Tax=Rangifer tarandus platyrhynchus TaxID=3082113 RepID=A0ACB0EVD4_RANTA|nr:unnamed protein product [Rangifer tarandus platyrhynchus]CAI9704563.1 unnamed protein product [Rangifer tarandus platyrhynchus]